MCNNIRYCHYNFDIENVRMCVYCNVMTASEALDPKYVEEIGTYKTHPYNCVAFHVFMCTWCGYV